MKPSLALPSAPSCPRLLALLLTLAIALPAAQAQSRPGAFEGLLACPQLTDAAARLACYDRELPRVAPMLAQPLPTAGTPAAAGGGAGAVATAPAAEARFGRRAAPEDAGPTQIVSTLPEGFSGWRAGDRIKLGNGQVWRIADDSTAFVRLQSLRVVVRQGAMGAFYLDFDGDKRSPRVRRVD